MIGRLQSFQSAIHVTNIKRKQPLFWRYWPVVFEYFSHYSMILLFQEIKLFYLKFWCSRFQFPFECWLDVISGCISSQQVFTLQRKCCILHDIVPLFLLFHSSYNVLTPQTSHQLFGITLTFLRVGLCSRSVALCFGSVGLRSSFLGFCFWNTLIFAGRKKIKNIFGWGTSFYSKIYLLIIIREENYSEY